MITCDLCEKPVDIKAFNSASRHMGWAERRKAGGANSLSLAGPALSWAHRSCLEVEIHRTKGARVPSPPGEMDCEFCGDPVVTGEVGSYTKYLAYSMTRAQGGTNALSLPSEPLGWAHGECVKKTKKQGEVNWESDSLF